MTTTTLRKKLAAYLEIADDKKIKAIYTMVEDDIDAADVDWNEDLVKELNRRKKSVEAGTAKTYTWEETK